MLTWADAAKALKDEGFFATLYVNPNGPFTGSAYHIPNGGKPHVDTELNDPVAAINDLLLKCRDRWPAPDPLDDLTLNQLLDHAVAQGWNVGLYHRDGGWRAFTSDAEFGSQGDTPAIALRKAIKQRRQNDAEGARSHVTLTTDGWVRSVPTPSPGPLLGPLGRVP